MSSNPVTLEDAIALVASHASAKGVTLTRTKLVKLLYFVDLRSWEQLAHTVTGVEWIWFHYGPYSPSVVEACERMSASGELQVTETTNFYGSPEWRIESAQALYYEPPGRDLVNLVRGVIAEFGRFSPAKIGDMSYETEPMRRLMARGGERGDVVEFESDPPALGEVSRVATRYQGLARRGQSQDEGDVGSGLKDEIAVH